jgi:hypothetical protein
MPRHPAAQRIQPGPPVEQLRQRAVDPLCVLQDMTLVSEVEPGYQLGDPPGSGSGREPDHHQAGSLRFVQGARGVNWFRGTRADQQRRGTGAHQSLDELAVELGVARNYRDAPEMIAVVLDHLQRMAPVHHPPKVGMSCQDIGLAQHPLLKQPRHRDLAPVEARVAGLVCARVHRCTLPEFQGSNAALRT